MKNILVSLFVMLSLTCSATYAMDSTEKSEKPTHKHKHSHSHKHKKAKKMKSHHHEHQHKHTSNKPHEGKTIAEEKAEQETELTNR